jgi:hypothetical protein
MSLGIAALSDEQNAQLAGLLDWLGDYRESLGLPREGGPPSMEEIKAGEHQRAVQAINDAMGEYGGTRSGSYQDAFAYLMRCHERNYPDFAWFTVEADCWTDEATAQLVETCWNIPEWPSQLGKNRWLKLWKRAGKVCNRDCAEYGEIGCAVAPEIEITLWRGASPKHKRGLSWTGDRSRAVWFASRFSSIFESKVYEVKVPARRILAHLTDRGENEYVVNVAGLDVREVDP